MDQQELPKFFYEIFDSSLPRLGPGDEASTQKALDILLSARARAVKAPDSGPLRILDLGCGNGAPTIQLAKHVRGTITAVDNHQPFLDELRRRAAAAGVADRIDVRLRDMRDTGLEKGSFDLVWSEGALFVAGFRRGLEICRDLLTPGGLLGASEMTWFRPDPPPECRDYLAAEYPAITDTAANLRVLTDCGFEILGHFALPESAWLESFYRPHRGPSPDAPGEVCRRSGKNRSDRVGPEGDRDLPEVLSLVRLYFLSGAPAIAPYPAKPNEFH